MCIALLIRCFQASGLDRKFVEFWQFVLRNFSRDFQFDFPLSISARCCIENGGRWVYLLDHIPVPHRVLPRYCWVHLSLWEHKLWKAGRSGPFWYYRSRACRWDCVVTVLEGSLFYLVCLAITIAGSSEMGRTGLALAHNWFQYHLETGELFYLFKARTTPPGRRSLDSHVSRSSRATTIRAV